MEGKKSSRGGERKNSLGRSLGSHFGSSLLKRKASRRQRARHGESQYKMNYPEHPSYQVLNLLPKEHLKPSQRKSLQSLVPLSPDRTLWRWPLSTLLAVTSEIYLHMYKHRLLLLFLDFFILSITYLLIIIRLEFSSLTVPKSQAGTCKWEVRDPPKGGSCCSPGYCQGMPLCWQIVPVKICSLLSC